MMINVPGKTYVRQGVRDVFLGASRNVYEEWGSEQAPLAFRGDGPSEDLTSASER